MKLYVLTADMDIGYISEICHCNECKIRGNAELTVNYLDGTFMFQTTLNEILNKIEIVMISDNKDDVINTKTLISKSNNHLCRYLENILLNT